MEVKDYAYYASLTPDQLTALIAAKDEDGRSLLHAACGTTGAITLLLLLY